MLKDDFLDYEAMNNDFTYWPGSVKSLAVARPHAFKHGSPETRSVDKSIRDCFHVQDGEDALESLPKQLTGQVFNFSNDIQATVLELVWKILRSMRSPLQHEPLGWQSLFKMDDALASRVVWYQEFLTQ